MIKANAPDGIEFFSIEKGEVYSSNEDIDQAIDAADPDTQNYLWIIKETMAKVGEANRLTWKTIILILKGYWHRYGVEIGSVASSLIPR